MRRGLSNRKLVSMLETGLAPVHPRKEFVSGLKKRLYSLPGVPVLVETPRHWAQSVGVGLIGLLGVLASAAAVAALAVRFAGRLLTALGLIVPARGRDSHKTSASAP